MIWTIAMREIATRGKSKGYLGSCAFLFLGVIAVAVVLSLIGGGGEARDVTIGLQGDAVNYDLTLEQGNDDLKVTTVTDADVESLEQGDIDVLFDGTTLTWDGFPDITLDAFLRESAQRLVFGERADAMGVTSQDLGELFAPIEIDEVRLDGGDDEFAVRAIAAGVAGGATFIMLQVWGAFMMLGVVEEKSSKVVEVLLSHVRPKTLLTGKLVGLGVLAFFQMLILVIGVVVGLTLWDDIAIPSGVWSMVPVLVITFVLGFGLYTTAFAAVGSMVSRVEDAQTAQLPVMLPLLAGYMIGASSFAAPDNLAVTIGSFVPLTSPVLLPVRIALVDVPLWQVVVSLALLALSIVALVQVAAAIYRYSLLRTGSRVTWGAALRNRKSAEI